MEFLNSLDLEILNQENVSTFCSGGMLEVWAPRKHYRLGGFIRADHSHILHFTGLRTGTPNQEP